MFRKNFVATQKNLGDSSESFAKGLQKFLRVLNFLRIFCLFREQISTFASLTNPSFLLVSLFKLITKLWSVCINVPTYLATHPPIYLLSDRHPSTHPSTTHPSITHPPTRIPPTHVFQKFVSFFNIFKIPKIFRNSSSIF